MAVFVHLFHPAMLELVEQERLLRTIIDVEPECVKLVDSNGTVRMMNRAGLGMLQATSVHEVIGRNVLDFVAQEYRAAFRALIDSVFRGESAALEFEAAGLRNGRRWLDTRAVPLHDDAGAIVALLGITRDITEQKRAESALREREAQYRALFEQANEGIYVADAEGRFLDVNPAACAMTGYRRDELIGRFGGDFVAPSEVPRVREEIARLSDGRTVTTEWEIHRKNGPPFVAEVTSTQLADGRLLSFVRDITDRKKAEAARADLQAQLLQAQKMESVGRLAGGIAHDFNNLLTVINGMADLAIASLEEQSPLRPDLHEIRLAGDRAARLTRQLLAMSRQQVLEPEVLNLADIVSSMENMLRRLIGEDVRLVLDTSGALGNVKADPGQIEQVILNLVVNARDAMPEGGRLAIAARNVDLDAAFAATHPGTVPGRYVQLTVTDTGIGMDEATLKHVFEPFFTTKEIGKGTGLGLSTVYGIVKQSGGTVWASSNRGAGTTFTIYLPRVDEQPRPRHTSAIHREAAGTETILLVEDEATIRELTRRILQSAGYRVLEAASGEEALRLMQGREAPDLLLTDVVMPGMGGRELASRLAKRRPHVKVLYTSGHTDDAIIRHGVDDTARFMAKPYTPAELKRRVRELLDA